MSKTVSILGWLGHSNFGDELILEGFRELFKNWNIQVYSNEPNPFYPVLDFDAVNRGDLFVLGGGELINRDRLFLPGYWSGRIIVPKIILGCGVNADKYNQLSQRTIQELEGYSFIGLRDRTAVELLQEHDVLRKRAGLFYDAAFSVKFEPIRVGVFSERTLVVVPTNRFSDKADKGILKFNIVKDAAKQIKQTEWIYNKIIFLAFGKEDNDDYQICLELAKYFPNKSSVINDFIVNRQQMLEAIAGATYIYSFRLHGYIIAKILGVPCGFYPYHHKLQRVADTLLGCEPSLIRSWQREYLNLILNQVMENKIC